jgi:hypothetical protein
MRTFLAGIRRRLAAERGAALVLGLGITIALTITGTTVAEYSTSDLHQANRSAADQSAFALAEAGLANALSVLGNPSNDPYDPTLLPTRTTTYTTGTATWSGTLDRATATWTLTATAETPTAPPQAPARRTVSERVRVLPVPTQPQPNRAWDYVYSTRTGTTCDEQINAKGAIASPLYVNGNLCVAASAGASGGPIAVKGKVNLAAADSYIGSSASPVVAAHVGLGCKYYTYAQHTPCTSADNVWGPADANGPAISPPAPSWDTWYANAAPGPNQPCTSQSGTPPTFENETVAPARNGSVTTSFSLTPPTSYSCRVGPADSPTGELSWDASSRTLTVNGTVFVDGSAKVDNGLVNSYQGQGTLYLSGTFFVSSSSKLCGKVAASGTDCDFPGWDPKNAFLTIVANGSGGQVPTGDGVQLGASASFEGGIFATYAVALGNYAQTKGPMIATTVVFASQVTAYGFGQLTITPTGTPGAQVSYGTLRTPEGFSG